MKKKNIYIISGILFGVAVIGNYTINKTDIKTKIETKEETIACSKKVEYSDTLFVGETKIIQECVEGLKTKTYRVEYDNDKELSRELISEDIIDPIDEIKLEGIKEKQEQNNLYDVSNNNNQNTDTTPPEGNIYTAPSGDGVYKTGFCKDGTSVYGDPSARGRANACYGHGGWVR